MEANKWTNEWTDRWMDRQTDGDDSITFLANRIGKYEVTKVHVNSKVNKTEKELSFHCYRTLSWQKLMPILDLSLNFRTLERK